MDLQEFIINLPVTTRDRDSKIKNALDGGKIYISLITKNNKKFFKLYYKQGGAIKTTQRKVNDTNKKYILKNAAIIEFSDGTKEYLHIQ